MDGKEAVYLHDEGRTAIISMTFPVIQLFKYWFRIHVPIRLAAMER